METINTGATTSTQATSTNLATATVQPDNAQQPSFLMEYGVDIFLLICIVAVYMIKTDPSLSLKNQQGKEENEPNELEKVLVTDNEDETKEIKETK